MADITPILVTVKDGRYECHSLTDVPSARDITLMGILSTMGGVNESVPEGDHYFNVVIKDGQPVASLVHIPEV